MRASWGESFGLYLQRNVLATQRLFEAAAAAGVRVVFASSSSVYGDAERYPTAEDVAPQPISPYGITKLACEQLAHAIGGGQGLDAVLLRYFTVYGPRQRPDMAFTAMLEALARGDSFRLFGDGSAARSFTYVGDAVAATIAAMERGRGGEVYNVGGGEEATMNEAIALAEAVAGRSLDVERTPGRHRRRPADEGRRGEGGGRAGLVAADRARRGHGGAVALGGGRVARVNRPEPVPDPDAEREVDLRSVWERIAARWWLPVLGIVLGAILGFALALGGGKVYEAETLVAMGQPFSPNGGAPVQAFLTNPRAVSEIVRSESALRRAAKRRRPAAARAARECQHPRPWAHPGPAPEPTGAPLVTIKVVAAQPGKAERAADALAKEVIAAHVRPVRRNEDHDLQRPARIDPGLAEQARAANHGGGAGRQRAGPQLDSTSSLSSARSTTPRPGAASCSTFRPTSNSSSRSPRTSRRRRSSSRRRRSRRLRAAAATAL